MKVGDLVRHRFDGRWDWDDVGLVLSIKRGASHPHLGLVNVFWNTQNAKPDSRKLYRIRDLEVVVK